MVISKAQKFHFTTPEGKEKENREREPVLSEGGGKGGLYCVLSLARAWDTFGANAEPDQQKAGWVELSQGGRDKNKVLIHSTHPSFVRPQCRATGKCCFLPGALFLSLLAHLKALYTDSLAWLDLTLFLRICHSVIFYLPSQASSCLSLFSALLCLFPHCFLSCVSFQHHSLHFITLWHTSFLLFFLCLRLVCIFSSKSPSPFPSLAFTYSVSLSLFLSIFLSFSVPQKDVLIFLLAILLSTLILTASLLG